SFTPRFSAAIDGWRIHVCRRLTFSSWPFSIWAWMALRSVSSAPASLGNVSAAAVAPATNVLRLSLDSSDISLQTLLGQKLDQIDDPHRIPPFVVVPRNHLHHISVEDFRQLSIHNRAVGIVHQVAGNHRIFGVRQNALERPRGGAL